MKWAFSDALRSRPAEDVAEEIEYMQRLLRKCKYRALTPTPEETLEACGLMSDEEVAA